METSTVDSESPSGLLRRVLVKAAGLGIAAAAALMLLAGSGPAAGVLAGCMAAGLYSFGYVRSHVYRQSAERVFDSRIARHMVVRLVVVSMVGAATFLLLGEPAVKAYLLAFLVGFPVLLISEFPRASRQLKARGIIG